ncbi:hypothetical protein QYE76_035430 [Lolium multiflorum]|uniref:CCHC-type domain-containing protein n=1 Tax=Lolium multiflorum TaxID=4521 RepID=A0AAD8R0V0_LOLMU|nr:hypothetical protein QYE76_035430 [Lolium multiflorum]
MIREGESVADAYARLGALRVRVKGLGVEKYNDGFEMNEAFIKSKVIAMIAVKQEDTNLALNLQIMTKSADLNSDDLVSYVAANENMAKAGKRLMAMNRVDEASHNHEAPHNLALKARADHGSKEDYEIEEEEEMTSTSDIATDFAFFAKKYKAKFPMLLNDKKKKKKRTCYNCDEDSHIANECPYEKRVDKPRFIKGVKPRLKPNPINDRYKKNKGRAFVGAEYLSDEEEEDEEKEAGVAGLAFSKPGSLFTYDYSKDYSTENDVGSSFMARTTQDDDSDDSPSSTIVGSCLMARETKQASILEENVRLTKELAKFTTAKNKMGLDDLLSKQRSNNQKFGLGYTPKSYKKNNYKKEKPAQDKNKKGYSSGGPKWVFDSGCTNHMTGGRGVLDQFIEDINKKSSITFGDNSKGKVLGYYNRSTGTIEVSCDVEFLEDNGSQVEQVVPCVAGNNDDPSSAIKHMGIGHIRPIEVHNDDQDDGVEVSSTAQVEPSSTQAEPSSATQEPSSTQDESHSEEQEESPHSTEQDHDDDQETSTTHDQAQVIPHDQALARDEFIDHEGTIRKIKAATRASDMKVDQVLGSISRGVEMRTVNPYRYEQRTYTGGDKFFWTKTQAALWDGFYDTRECMKNGVVVMPKAINPDELALHEATKYRFVVDTLKVPLHFFHDDADRTMTWMTGREKYSCTYTQFCAAMGFGGGRAQGYKIHSRPKLTRGDIFFCYPSNPTAGPPTISGMYYSYLVLAKMFRESLISKSGDSSEVRNYHLNLMYYCHPARIRKIDGCDLIHCELKRAVMDRMTPNYAQYVQRLINYIVPAPLNTLDERVIMEPFRFPTQDGRPEVPSMMPSHERRSKEHHDPAAGSSYSRRSKHGAARFFSSMWQMCKNTNDVAHQSLALNQETRRRQNEFMASRHAPVPPSGPEMEPVVAPQWEMPLLTDEMIQNFDFSMYALGGPPPRTARAPTPTDDDGDEDQGDAAARDDGESSYSSGHQFY